MALLPRRTTRCGCCCRCVRDLRRRWSVRRANLPASPSMGCARIVSTLLRAKSVTMNRMSMCAAPVQAGSVPTALPEPELGWAGALTRTEAPANALRHSRSSQTKHIHENVPCPAPSSTTYRGGSCGCSTQAEAAGAVAFARMCAAAVRRRSLAYPTITRAYSRARYELVVARKGTGPAAPHAALPLLS